MTVPLRVHKVVQTACGHVTIYDATLEFLDAPHVTAAFATQAKIENRYSPEEWIAEALNSIQEGARRALAGTDRGAKIEVTRLVIHPVDFKPTMYCLLTEQTVKSLLDPA